jgi:hypothetical protein
MKDHGFPYVGLQYSVHYKPSSLERFLEIYREVGLPLDKLMYQKDKFFRTDFRSRPEEAKKVAGELVAVLRKHEPDANFYFYGHDEAKGEQISAQFPLWAAVHEAGGKIWVSTQGATHPSGGATELNIKGGG